MPKRTTEAQRLEQEQLSLFKRLHVEITMEAVIAGAALLLSVVTAVVQIVIALRGPVVDVMPAKEGLLYWDGTKSGAVLSAAFDVTMTNSAPAEHGDIVDSAELSLSVPGLKEPVKFPIQSLVRPHLTDDDPQKVQDKCDVRYRCIGAPLDGLVVIENPEQFISLPGSQARSDYLSFALEESGCEGKACAKFGEFAQTEQLLQGQMLSIDITLMFHLAGPRQQHCQFSRSVDGHTLLRKRFLTVGLNCSIVKPGWWSSLIDWM